MKIQLIKAPTINTGMPEHNWYMPLNLIWLANWIRPYYDDIEILDGQLMTLEEIISKINADVVGVSFDALSIDSFNSIIRYAKSIGAYTVTGGHLPTALSDILLKNNPYLDSIITFDGEDALLYLIQAIEDHTCKSKVPNLIWKSGDKIIGNHQIDSNLNQLPLLERDIGGLNLEQYVNNFQTSKNQQNLNLAYNRPTNSYSHKGCIFRQNGNGCSFCSRVDKSFRLRPAEKIYSEYLLLQEKYAIDYISDFSDSWIYAPFLKQLSNQYEIRGELTAKLRVYGDIRLINEENIKLMKQIGVDTVLLGIESGDERILKLNGKPIKPTDIIKTVELLSKYDIQIADAYVLGLIGETEKSLENTLLLSQKIKQIAKTEITYCNIMTPLPGNKVWPFIKEKFGIKDYPSILSGFNIERFEIESLIIFCKLGINGFQLLQEIRNQILDNSKIASKEFVN